MWERGLKFGMHRMNLVPTPVAPLVGAWIEIYAYENFVEMYGRSPCGSVD